MQEPRAGWLAGSVMMTIVTRIAMECFMTVIMHYSSSHLPSGEETIRPGKNPRFQDIRYRMALRNGGDTNLSPLCVGDDDDDLMLAEIVLDDIAPPGLTQPPQARANEGHTETAGSSSTKRPPLRMR
eukprot:3438633-Amphidinium_carterae.1